MSKASHSCMKRAALSAPSLSMAPARWAGLLAMMPTGRPSMRTSAVTMPRPKPRRSSSTEPVSASVVDHLAHVVDAQPVLGDDVAQQALVGALPRRRRGPGSTTGTAWPPRRPRPRRRRRCRRRRWAPGTSIGPTSSGRNTPRPPPSIIAGPPMPMFESSVAMITSQQPSSAALPAKQRPEVMPTSGTRPLQPRRTRCERPCSRGRPRPMRVGVARAGRRRPR